MRPCCLTELAWTTCIAMRTTSLQCRSLQRTSLQRRSPHRTAPHVTARHRTSPHVTALHRIALHCARAATLPCVGSAPTGWRSLPTEHPHGSPQSSTPVVERSGRSRSREGPACSIRCLNPWASSLLGDVECPRSATYPAPRTIVFRLTSFHVKPCQARGGRRTCTDAI